MTRDSQAGEAPREEVLESFQDLLERLCPLCGPKWLCGLEGIGWEGALEEMRTTRTPG